MNKRTNNNYPDETPLDDYEKQLKDFLDKGEYVSAPKKELEKTKKILREAARNYLEMQKSKSITLRVNNSDLIKVKVKAKKNGIPYQRIIGTLIRQYAEEKINIAI